MEESVCQRAIVRGVDCHHSLYGHLKVNLLISSSLIDSGSGVLLQRFVNQYDALPLILPVTSSLAGNVGCVFASRLSTEYHADSTIAQRSSMRSRENLIVMGTLFSISVPIHLAFLGFIHLLGTYKFGVVFMFVYLIIGALSVSILLIAVC